MRMAAGSDSTTPARAPGTRDDRHRRPGNDPRSRARDDSGVAGTRRSDGGQPQAASRYPRGFPEGRLLPGDAAARLRRARIAVRDPDRDVDGARPGLPVERLGRRPARLSRLAPRHDAGGGRRRRSGVATRKPASRRPSRARKSRPSAGMADSGYRGAGRSPAASIIAGGRSWWPTLPAVERRFEPGAPLSGRAARRLSDRRYLERHRARGDRQQRHRGGGCLRPRPQGRAFRRAVRGGGAGLRGQSGIPLPAAANGGVQLQPGRRGASVRRGERSSI